MIVALYARVSTTKQVEKDLSIPDQLRQMREWCERQGYSVAAEYVEAGASATDDRRPVFQKMIQESCIKPAPYTAIIIHSLSRFFRDALEFGLHERQLGKFGVRVISITQQTSDDPAGEMARRVFSIFDEYQSKENAKHTLRAMKENARQGYFNGSSPPFGYSVDPVKIRGRKGYKKQLVINPEEAQVVRRIFDLYIHGHQANPVGVFQISARLNQQGLTRRGKRWSKSTVADLLSNTAYIGEYYFNKKKAKNRTVKEKEDWVLVKVPPIIDGDVFTTAEKLREVRSPVTTPPRVVNSPTLLTGMLKCSCGAAMTIATGKGGRYRYYKCTSRTNAGKHTCDTKSIPMGKLDQLILDAMAEKVFTPDRVAHMLKVLQNRLRASRGKHDDLLQDLKKELDAVGQAMDRLYEAVERNLIPMDETLQERVRKHQTRRQEVLTRMTGLRHQKELPMAELTPKKITEFCRMLKDKFCDAEACFGKAYLRLLLEEIRVEGQEIRIRGSYAALAGMLQKTKVGLLDGVPTFGGSWLPGPDSNQRQGG